MKSVGSVEFSYMGTDGLAHSMVTWRSPRALKEIEKLNDEELVITMKEVGKDRSLQQNALMWELIGRIAKSENAPYHDPIDMYGEILKTAKAKFTYIKVMEKALDDVRRQNGVRHVQILGWETSEKGVSWANCRLFLGTSTMNTKEMNKVIDAAKWWASNLEVPWDDIL